MVEKELLAAVIYLNFWRDDGAALAALVLGSFQECRG